mgnify:CR=1 FL=1
MSTSGGEKSGSRRRARRKAFEVLYGLGFEPVTGETGLRKRFDDSPQKEDSRPQGPGMAYAWDLTLGVWRHTDELDETIAKYSKNWRLSRIGRIEMTILRIAMFEILMQEDIPLRVAINEAVELAKSYGDDNSPNFINGILDALAKAVDGGGFSVKKGL